jgi:hypothetical protein
MWNLLARLDRRIIFLLVAVTVVVPMLITIPFPVPPTNATLAAFNTIEGFKEGDAILLSCSYGPSSMAEVQPQFEAVLRHAFRKGIRVLVISLNPDAAPLAARGITRVVNSDEFQTNGTSRLLEGTHYVNFGYRLGADTLIRRLGQNIPEFIQTDSRGERLSTLPVMAGITNYDQIRLVFDFAAGDSPDWWVVDGQGRYGVKVAVGVTGVMVSQQFPYLNSGQLVGLIGGGVGAAEYEQLIKSPGAGTRRVSTLSFVHLFVIAIVILGNVLYFRERRRAPEGGRT